MIHLVIGLPGAGKSTVEAYLSVILGALAYSTDHVCERLFPQRSTSDVVDFTPQELEIVYRALPLILSAAKRARPDVHIVFSGSFRYSWQRQLMIDAAAAAGSVASVVLVEAPAGSIEERLRKRCEETSQQGSVSGHLKVAAEFEYPADAFVINNDDDKEKLRRAVEAYAAFSTLRRLN